MAIILDHVSHIYEEGTAMEVAALKDVNLVIPDGQLIGLIGHTGSGKIHAGTAFERPYEAYFQGIFIIMGRISMKKVIIKRNSRSKVGLVFQYPEHQLFGDRCIFGCLFRAEKYGAG